MNIYILLYHHNDINNDYANIQLVNKDYSLVKSKYDDMKKALLNKGLIILEETNNYVKFTDKYNEKLFEISIEEKTF